MHRIKNIHFIGIGGSGMSGIAEVLLNQGYTVTGSDKSTNSAIARLRSLGANIFSEHTASNITNTNVVVASSAIDRDNPEIVAAKALRIPILPRAQMLAELMRFHFGIAISGTHGKTTTTSIVASLLAESGLDPTFVIGGLLNSAGSHARLGKGRYFVAEADESDASFLHLSPTLSVITNIDADHMQTYDNDFSKLKKSFIDFAHRLPFYGVVIACIDDHNIREILPQISRTIITYGFSEDADIQGSEYEQSGWQSHFKVTRKSLQRSSHPTTTQTNAEPLDITLNLPGKHNALNALAAIAIASELKIADAAVQTALINFGGVGRRMQVHGALHLPRGTALLVDDYGHHPTEIKVTLQALRDAWPDKRIVLAFQPHRYSRTQALFDDFVAVLSEADLLLLLDIYAAGESPLAEITGQMLAHSIRQRGKVNPIFVKDTDELFKVIHDVVGTNDLLLLQGAGNIGTLPQKLMQTETR